MCLSRQFVEETKTSIDELFIEYDHKPVKKEINEDGTFKFDNKLLKSDDNGFVTEVLTGKQRPELRYDSKTGQLFNVFCKILKDKQVVAVVDGNNLKVLPPQGNMPDIDNLLTFKGHLFGNPDKKSAVSRRQTANKLISSTKTPPPNAPPGSKVQIPIDPSKVVSVDGLDIRLCIDRPAEVEAFVKIVYDDRSPITTATVENLWFALKDLGIDVSYGVLEALKREEVDTNSAELSFSDF